MTEFNESSKKIGNEPNHILEIIESIFAKDPKRDIIFKQLIDSSRFANLISELSWSVTLYKNGFRMNVGPVEALLYFDGIISINFLAQKENGTILSIRIAQKIIGPLPILKCPRKEVLSN